MTQETPTSTVTGGGLVGCDSPSERGREREADDPENGFDSPPGRVEDGFYPVVAVVEAYGYAYGVGDDDEEDDFGCHFRGLSVVVLI